MEVKSSTCDILRLSEYVFSAHHISLNITSAQSNFHFYYFCFVHFTTGVHHLETIKQVCLFFCTPYLSHHAHDKVGKWSQRP